MTLVKVKETVLWRGQGRRQCSTTTQKKKKLKLEEISKYNLFADKMCGLKRKSDQAMISVIQSSILIIITFSSSP